MLLSQVEWHLHLHGESLNDCLKQLHQWKMSFSYLSSLSSLSSILIEMKAREVRVNDDINRSVMHLISPSIVSCEGYKGIQEFG